MFVNIMLIASLIGAAILMCSNNQKILSTTIIVELVIYILLLIPSILERNVKCIVICIIAIILNSIVIIRTRNMNTTDTTGTTESRDIAN